MASPTTIRYSLLKTRRGFGDKLFLTMGDGAAGMSSYNPMLVGLGVRFVVFGNKDTRSVRYKLSRVVDDDITDVAERHLVKIDTNQWAVEGALGGPKLGFPQDPQPNYGTPQCFRIELISHNISRRVSQVFYFWIASGPSGTIAETLDRVESGMAPVACCFFGVPDGGGGDDAWHPAAVEPYPASKVFGGDPVDCFPPGSIEATSQDPDEGVYVPGQQDPIFHENNAPTPIAPWYDEPALPAQTTEQEMFTNGFAPSWFHVIGDDNSWHAHMIQHLAPAVAPAVPGGVVNDIPLDYAEGPSLIAGPANAGLPILDDFWRLDPNSPASYTIDTAGQIVLLTLSPPSWESGAKNFIICGGKDATWDGGTLNGQNFAYKPVSTFADLLVSPSFSPPRIYNFTTGLWDTNPGDKGLAAVVGPIAAGPVVIEFPLFPGLVPGDVMAVQVVVASGGTISIIQPAVPFGYHLPDNAQASNVYKMTVV